MIIGLTGRNAAGKGEVANFLKSKSFTYYSLSDVIRQEVARQKLVLTRENLVSTGNRLRAEQGPGYLAERILKKIGNDAHYVVDSFRHPREVEVFRRRGDFHFLLVEADPEIRFERLKQRGRENDPHTLREFMQLEEREYSGADPFGQHLQACEHLADLRLANNGNLADLRQSAASFLTQLLQDHERPEWDEYFMRLAKVASLRSNCVKRKVAAIVVLDRRVISTGYNGTPRGTRNCFEGGCPRCNNLADSGTQLEECLCSHGEENAIIQAAYHGVRVKGATLYTTFAPCLMCTKMIINAGLREVVYNLEYPLNETSFRLLKEAGVLCRQYRVQ